MNKHAKPRVDAAVLIAEDFVDDVGRLTDFLFAQARKRSNAGRRLRNNIQTWMKMYPPIGMRMF